jgi:hypothetical protein
MELTLYCGRRVRVAEIMMFNAERLGQLVVMRQRANEKMGGVSTGLGFWGSPGWVIGGVIALGALEHWLSGKAAKEGLQILEQAQQLYYSIKSDGQYFSIIEVNNSHMPNPELWTVSRAVKKEFKLGTMRFKERRLTITQHNISMMERWRGKTERSIDTSWIHNGDPFIYVKEDNGVSCAIRWDAVSHFSPD